MPTQVITNDLKVSTSLSTQDFLKSTYSYLKDYVSNYIKNNIAQDGHKYIYEYSLLVTNGSPDILSFNLKDYLSDGTNTGLNIKFSFNIIGQSFTPLDYFYDYTNQGDLIYESVSEEIIEVIEEDQEDPVCDELTSKLLEKKFTFYNWDFKKVSNINNHDFSLLQKSFYIFMNDRSLIFDKIYISYKKGEKNLWVYTDKNKEGILFGDVFIASAFECGTKEFVFDDIKDDIVPPEALTNCEKKRKLIENKTILEYDFPFLDKPTYTGISTYSSNDGLLSLYLRCLENQTQGKSRVAETSFLLLDGETSLYIFDNYNEYLVKFNNAFDDPHQECKQVFFKLEDALSSYNHYEPEPDELRTDIQKELDNNNLDNTPFSCLMSSDWASKNVVEEDLTDITDFDNLTFSEREHLWMFGKTPQEAQQEFDDRKSKVRASWKEHKDNFRARKKFTRRDTAYLGSERGDD